MQYCKPARKLDLFNMAALGNSLKFLMAVGRKSGQFVPHRTSFIGKGNLKPLKIVIILPLFNICGIQNFHNFYLVFGEQPWPNGWSMCTMICSDISPVRVAGWVRKDI